MVLSMIAYSLSASVARCWKSRLQTPDLAHRLNRRWTFLPVAEALWQIAPGDAGAVAVKHRLDEPAVVRRGHADMSLPPRQQVLDPLPLVVATFVAAHRSASKADRLRIE